MMEVKIYLLMLPVARKCQVYAVLFVVEYLNYLPLASQHVPVKFGNPSCIHLPYEKYM